MNILFLDYDGVVNNVLWNSDGTKASYGYPSDNKVNDFQAVQWVSEFCQKMNYKIVVTSTWRKKPNYKECLVNGGLRKGIEILGCTDVFEENASRGSEITKYLEDHPDIENWLVVDDESVFDGYPEILNRFVHCRCNQGFGMDEYSFAVYLHKLNIGEFAKEFDKIEDL